MSSPAAQPQFTPEFAATYRAVTLGRIQQEGKTTRRVVGNIPEDKKNYKPQENSRTAWELASHLVSSDIWFLNGIADRKFEWTGEPAPIANNVAGLVAHHEAETAKAAARVNALTAAQLLEPVDFFGIMKMPAFLFLQFAQDHAVHHRGQLSTYLRPMGAKVPDIYGGSFDEPFQG
jgi:uncharacterized damage-inducible protein DinB